MYSEETNVKGSLIVQQRRQVPAEHTAINTVLNRSKYLSQKENTGM
jgi:hypothetical protein